MKRKVIFLDRDGVLNVEVSYLHKIEDFQWQEGAKEALQEAVAREYDLVVVTNQSGVARGYFTEEDVQILHNFMKAELSKIGVNLLAIYYCPHLVGATVPEYDKNCNCRKPKPGLLLQAFSDFEISQDDSFLVGDSPRDVEAAEAAGIKGYLFPGGNLKTFLHPILIKQQGK